MFNFVKRPLAETNVVVHTCNASTREDEAGGSLSITARSLLIFKKWGWDLALLVESLSSMHEALCPIPAQGVIVHTCNPSTPEEEAGGSEV